MGDTMHTGVAASDQLAAAELRHRFPAFLEHVECVAIFEVLERNEPISEHCPEVLREPPFADDSPEAVLAYLARYTHRVAISNRRLFAFDETGVTFRFKDYRRDGPKR